MTEIISAWYHSMFVSPALNILGGVGVLPFFGTAFLYVALAFLVAEYVMSLQFASLVDGMRDDFQSLMYTYHSERKAMDYNKIGWLTLVTTVAFVALSTTQSVSLIVALLILGTVTVVYAGYRRGSSAFAFVSMVILRRKGKIVLEDEIVEENNDSIS